MNATITIFNIFNEKVNISGYIALENLNTEKIYLYDEDGDFFIIAQKDILNITFN